MTPVAEEEVFASSRSAI